MKKYISPEGKMYKYFSEGATARVYKDKDEVVKIYKSDIPNFWKLDPVIFDRLKDLNNPHLLKLKSKIFQSDYILKGYTYKYINERKQDILSLPFDIIMQNIHEIDLLIRELTLQGIMISDTKDDHLLFDGEKYIIIDPDFYNYKIDSLNDLLSYNRSEMLDYFRAKFVRSLGATGENYDLVEDTFKVNLSSGYDLAYETESNIKKLLLNKR